MKKRLLLACTVALLFQSVIACGEDGKTIELRAGDHVFTVEVARTDAERAKGLMNRETLAENHGMIFVYQQDQHMAFWMKNTSIPLSIAFISKDGTIREIRDMQPYSLRTIESKNAVRYALEVPQGNFERLGIKPGDRIEIPPEVRSASGG